MISLLLESTVRSLAFAGVIGLALQISRVRNVSTRLAAWTCVLYGALLLPLAVPFLPPLAVHVPDRAANQRVITLPVETFRTYRAEMSAEAPRAHFNWRTAGMEIYLSVAIGLLGRLAFGLMVTRRLRRTTRPVNDPRVLATLSAQSYQASIRTLPALAESNALAVPITLGWMRPCIILPDSWREWPDATTEAVLAHELSHVQRGDYAMLLAASLYRCLFWFSPLAWWLDKHLRELTEQASDDSALRATADRTQYAEVLLGFFEALQSQRGRIRWQGVAMARGARAGRRIDRILAEDHKLSTPARWPVMAALAVLTVPLLYLCGTFQPVAMAQPTNKSEDSYVIVSGDITTMNGSNRDFEQALSFKHQIGEEYIWFRRDDKAYVIRDAGILKAAHKLFEPQHELGVRQGVLGEQQGKLGELQAALGEKQSTVRTTPPDLTRDIERLKEKLKTAATAEDLGDVQALLGELQSKIAEKQASLGGDQAKLGEAQAKLGEQQAKLGEEQAKLGEQQAKLAEKAGRQLKALIDEAFKKGVVESEPR
ncbi:MAG TPA: M56 family metallopeptidase [Bryobacteraceae bacterium]|jgi:beta-lactamase regulating signal transducer with metallopeptidase domain|nr:M56 family metallopeptidase [Bryobacteraceae bacterium]